MGGASTLAAALLLLLLSQQLARQAETKQIDGLEHEANALRVGVVGREHVETHAFGERRLRGRAQRMVEKHVREERLGERRLEACHRRTETQDGIDRMLSQRARQSADPLCQRRAALRAPELSITESGRSCRERACGCRWRCGGAGRRSGARGAWLKDDNVVLGESIELGECGNALRRFEDRRETARSLLDDVGVRVDEEGRETAQNGAVQRQLRRIVARGRVNVGLRLGRRQGIELRAAA